MILGKFQSLKNPQDSGENEGKNIKIFLVYKKKHVEWQLLMQYFWCCVEGLKMDVIKRSDFIANIIPFYVLPLAIRLDQR